MRLSCSTVSFFAFGAITLSGCDSSSDSGGGGAASSVGGKSASGSSGGGEETPRGGASAEAGASAQASGGAGAADVSAGGSGEGGASDCPSVVETDFEAGEGGEQCLTYEGASRVCGVSSDEAICTFAVSCGGSGGDVGQCQINCEMGTTIGCETTEMVACVLSAFCGADCDALTACGFVL